MSDWAGGYVADIEYLPGLYVEQAPSHLELACLLNGIATPATNGRISYCELGCGQGVTAHVIAAANPHMDVVAADFNPAHIARARAVADAAGLENITFLELSFEEMADDAHLPDFEMVTLHGVWSWISDADRRHIARFLRRRVKPGGLVSLSYNAMPGWTAMLPIQRLLLEHARLAQGRSDARILEGITWIEQLQAGGSDALGTTAMLDQLRYGHAKDRAGTDTAERAVYLAHEYLNANWEPQYHQDTAGLLAEAKLGFIGSAALTENFPDLVFTPQQRAILAGVPAGPLRETVKDYLVKRPFRRDLFMRGPRLMPDSQRDARLRDFALALSVPRTQARTELEVPAGKAQLPVEFYTPVLEALAARPQTLGELRDLPALRGTTRAPSMVEIAGILVGSGQALPMPSRTETKTDPAVRFNRLSTQEVAEQRATSAAIAAPRTGSGMTLATMEAAVFHAIATGLPVVAETLTDHVQARVAASGVPLVRDGVVIHSTADQRAVVAESVDWCLDQRLALWRQIGALPPDAPA